MPNRPYILDELTWKTVRDTRYEVAVLPWGATEAHNYHLPYTTDNIQAEQVAARAAERAWQRGAKVVVLPGVPFGVNTGQLDIPLCINMNPTTQALLLRDVAGFSYNEIAEILGTTLATVKWLIYRAREDVQRALAQEGLARPGAGPARAAAAAG